MTDRQEKNAADKIVDEGFDTDTLHRTTVRERMGMVLPSFLPKARRPVITGSRLVELMSRVKNFNAARPTLRYHLSIMSQNPSTCIIKVAKGQGYYLRPMNLRAGNEIGQLNQITKLTEQLDVATTVIANFSGHRDHLHTEVSLNKERWNLISHLIEIDPERWNKFADVHRDKKD